ncbi:MAG: shikimate dehydrogenase [Planctomycetota bacterium]|nr:shikimate dehydrogenase [Planctomycetota bacterium]
MICVTIARETNDELRRSWEMAARAGAGLAEIRLDYLTEPLDWKGLLRDKPTPVLVTVRRTIDGGRWSGDESSRRALIIEATENGTDWVDIEVDIAHHLPRTGISRRIISFHDMMATPCNLDEITQRCRDGDADLIKLAVMGHSLNDALNLLGSVARSHAKSPTMGLSMGDWGQFTRVVNARFGQSWTYAAFDSSSSPAPGMITHSDLVGIYGYNRICASTKLFGVIGDPVHHSKSPLVHNLAFRHHDLDMVYVPIRISAGDLDGFIRRMRDWGFYGLSVTIPHKESVIELLDEVDSLVALTGSCNTVLAGVAEGGRLEGFNTDLAAALGSLSEAVGGGPQALSGKQVLLIGAGGVARSLAYGLSRAGAEVVITNRTFSRALDLCTEVGSGVRVVAWADREGVARESAIIVNATSVGMSPNLEYSPLDGNSMHSRQVVFDTIYTPEWTKLLSDARTAGATTLSGVGMFVRQAVAQSELFTGGLVAPSGTMSESLRTSLKKAV